MSRTFIAKFFPYVSNYKELDGLKKLEFRKNESIQFLSDTVLNSSSFYTNETNDQWILVFFENSIYKKIIEVKIESCRLSKLDNTPEKGQYHWKMICHIENNRTQNGEIASDLFTDEIVEAMSKYIRSSKTITKDKYRESKDAFYEVIDPYGFGFFSTINDNEPPYYNANFSRRILLTALLFTYNDILSVFVNKLDELNTIQDEDERVKEIKYLYNKNLEFNTIYSNSDLINPQRDIKYTWKNLDSMFELSSRVDNVDKRLTALNNDIIRKEEAQYRKNRLSQEKHILEGKNNTQNSGLYEPNTKNEKGFLSLINNIITYILK
ncbi:Uncharacterised protein [Gallibacterium anatis]|uniref:Uncharacterized protein n=1 Tax=Gallibacterium anatis TaxID=750 RepID=A0A377H4B7_9PAST|nr:hypothetical protein [Gallibacterium anatis]KGQ59349.1 hypothetical protein IE01_00070 [Gallibacterium anatis DSM 16844 = F 149]STO37425.1 Uncharacterised protein [Gallibacterium anatis]